MYILYVNVLNRDGKILLGSIHGRAYVGPKSLVIKRANEFAKGRKCLVEINPYDRRYQDPPEMSYVLNAA